MRTLKIVIAGLTLMGCEASEKQRFEEEAWDKRRAEAGCSTALLNASLDISEGKIDTISKTDIKAACSHDALKDRAIGELKDSLKDGESARIKEDSLSGLTYTGQVNSKNSYGAYTGFKAFKVELDDYGRWDVTIYD